MDLRSAVHCMAFATGMIMIDSPTQPVANLVHLFWKCMPRPSLLSRSPRSHRRHSPCHANASGANLAATRHCHNTIRMASSKSAHGTKSRPWCTRASADCSRERGHLLFHSQLSVSGCSSFFGCVASRRRRRGGYDCGATRSDELGTNAKRRVIPLVTGDGVASTEW